MRTAKTVAQSRRVESRTKEMPKPDTGDVLRPSLIHITLNVRFPDWPISALGRVRPSELSKAAVQEREPSQRRVLRVQRT